MAISTDSQVHAPSASTAQVKPAFADKIDVDVKLLSVTPYLPSR